MLGTDPMFFDAARRPGLYATSVEPRYRPLGADMFADNPLAGMLFQMGSQWMFGGEGMIPGQFLPAQNVYDQIRARQFQAERLSAMQAGFEHDRAAMIQTMRGVAQMTGVNFGLDQLRAAGRLADTGAAVLPYVAQVAPLTFDAMYGAEGSQGLAARALFARSGHEVDPVTGQVGQTGATVARITDRMFQDIYRSGAPGSGLAAMRGIGIGGAAAIAVEMERLGIAGGSVGALPAAERDRMAADFMRRNGGDRDDALRGIQAGQTADRVKQMAGAVSAIKDLFGENGRQDAPMQELFQALSNLTSGGLMAQDPRRLEDSVRKAQALMRTGGMGLDAYSSLLARGNQVAANFGLDPTLAAGLTMTGVAAGSAFAQVRGLSAPAVGRIDREQYVMRQQELAGAAAGSETANALAAMVRYQRTTGGLRGEALDIVQKVERGEDLGYMAMPRMAAAFRASAGTDADLFLRSREANAAYRERVGGSVYRMQAAEAERTLGAGAFLSALRSHGVQGAEASQIALRMGRAFFAMDGEAFADDRKRTDALAAALGGERALAGRGDLRQIAEAAYGQFGILAGQAGYKPQEAYQLFNREARERAAAVEGQAQQEAAMARALSPLNRAGPIARLVDAIKGPSEDFMSTMGRFLGNVPAGDLSKAAAGAAGGQGDVAANVAGREAGTRRTLVADAMRTTQAQFDTAREAGRAGDAAVAIRRMEALAGGGTGAEAAYQQLRKEIRDQKGLSDAELDAAIRDPKSVLLSAAQRSQLLGLAAVGRGDKAMGAAALAGAAGVATDARVGGAELGDTAERALRARDYLIAGRGMAGDDDAARTNKAETRRKGAVLGQVSLSAAWSQADAALGDESGRSAAAFGAGGVSRLIAQEKAAREAQDIAARQRLSVEELLASDGGSREVQEARDQVRERLATVAGLGNELANMYRKNARAGYQLTDAEKAEMATFRKAQAASPAEASEAMLGRLLKTTRSSLSDADRKALVGQMSKVRDQSQLRLALEGAASTYERAEATGGDASAEDRERMGGLWDAGDARGGRHLGTDSGVARRAIEKLVRREETRQKDEAAPKPMEVVLRGNVQITGNDLRFTETRGTGTVPAAGGA